MSAAKAKAGELRAKLGEMQASVPAEPVFVANYEPQEQAAEGRKTDPLRHPPNECYG
jgi:hypothetical protein